MMLRRAILPWSMLVLILVLVVLQGCAVAIGAAGGALLTSQVCRHPATAHTNQWLCGQR